MWILRSTEDWHFIEVDGYKLSDIFNFWNKALAPGLTVSLLYRIISLYHVWGYLNNFQKSEKLKVKANFILKDKK
jgi:hypothetical protein